MISWYAVMTGPQNEAKADARLREQGLSTYYPVSKVRRKFKLRGRNAHEIKWVICPRYPRYLFVRCSPEMLWAVNSTDGVSSVVSFAGEAARISDDNMDRLIVLCDKAADLDETASKPRELFRRGDEVEFKNDGPLPTLTAQIAFDTGKSIGVISRMFGVEREFEVSPDMIAKIA